MVAKHSLMARMVKLENMKRTGFECIHEFKESNCITLSETKALAGVKLVFADMADETVLSDNQIQIRRSIRAKYSSQNQPPRILQEYY